ncbi:helix-turn-helix domain-containing protein [Parahaliea maris]|uniref:Helix-turn-helix domain-containing protein n=1 Tax=Parahaliea maris TaxID=2716870 RepID=A0A5C8ZSP2_9GAMM|nr:helix-turn-helix domain-containing protein [Parahaliea maris]TXS90321.1 helix-turn-helix domain-containing protein [Parahaliea maris]
MTVHTMSDKELQRLDTIERVRDKELTRSQAAEILGLSVRQVQRLCPR